LIEEQTVINEEELAQKIVSENLEAVGSLKTALMQLHTDETLIFRTPKRRR
jgi:hypothetical protein